MEILKNFWVFEGLDGAGTTTQQKLLIQKLESSKIKCFATAEPTSFETGKFLRSVLSGEIEACQSTISFLFAADRDNHLYNKKNGVLSHLSKGEIVVSDRYFFSSMAYQSINFELDKVKLLNSFFPYPELVFYIDTPVEKCLERIEKRGNKKEIYEKADYQRKVHNGYENCFKELPKGCTLFRIDGLNNIETISDEIFSSIHSFIGCSSL